MQTLTQAYNLGYIFYPPENPQDPGHPRLDITMQVEPTYRHFDPEHVFVTVFSPTEGLQTLKLQHPWTGMDQFHIYPGRVTMQDRLNKTATAFTFGGELKIETEEEKTTCILTSKAPIMGLIFDRAISVALTEQAEIYLAELRATWAKNPEALEKRLSEADPLEFYTAFLDLLRDKFKICPPLENSLTTEFMHYLYVTSHEIHGAQFERQNSQLFSSLSSLPV